MLHEIKQIQWWLLNHVGFHVPDGNYIVPIGGKKYMVAVIDGRVHIKAEALCPNTK